MTDNATHGSVLVVDDEPVICDVCRDGLSQAGYEVHTISDPLQAVGRLRERSFDVVLTDIRMPFMSGIELVKLVRESSPAQPVVMMTGYPELTAAIDALNQGATAFICKPFSMDELTQAVGQALFQFNLLCEAVRFQTQSSLSRDLNKLFAEIINSLASLVDERDSATFDHCRRVADISVAIGKKMRLTYEENQALELAGRLHDIGKVGIPDSILHKEGKLLTDEYETIKTHPERGYKILKQVDQLATVAEAVYCHHEWHNGEGYPRGLKQDEIPIEGAILAVADALESMLTGRPYKKKRTFDEALQIIEQSSGRQFRPEVVEALKALKEKDLHIS